MKVFIEAPYSLVAYDSIIAIEPYLHADSGLYRVQLRTAVSVHTVTSGLDDIAAAVVFAENIVNSATRTHKPVVTLSDIESYKPSVSLPSRVDN